MREKILSYLGRKAVLAVGLIIIGICSRTVFHIAPNVELVTTLSLVAGFFLGGIYAFAVPLGIMVGSDMAIGNTSIFVFTWSAYLIGGGLGLGLRLLGLNKKIVLAGLGSGLAFSLFFYLYTNFGVWLITPWYEKSLSGLLYCYYMGLPFLKPQLIGNVVLVPVGFLIGEYLRLKLGRKVIRASLGADLRKIKN
ncbi:MAG: hypothetical protein PHH01_00190 [Patescibacteria group bacterium]|nr:hypothetical protein [Patescibacteria group bacterium]